MYLLDHKADPLIRTVCGDTVLDFAQSRLEDAVYTRIVDVANERLREKGFAGGIKVADYR